ncbi:MAG: cytochrome C [Planctomycetota bacterium]|jgi:hypothetical protein
MEHSKHIIRAVLLLVLVAVVFVVVRHFLIPKSFGQYGHFRGDNIAEIAAKSPVHGGRESCVECHADEVDYVSEEEHGSISCEVCHAPVAAHAAAGEKIADMPVHRTTALCSWCHQRLDARPDTFPQINFVEHVTDKGGEFNEGICWECHEYAHDPTE